MMEKSQATKTIAEALELLENAHHEFFKDATANEDVEVDDKLVDAMDLLQEIVEMVG